LFYRSTAPKGTDIGLLLGYVVGQEFFQEILTLEFHILVMIISNYFTSHKHDLFPSKGPHC